VLASARLESGVCVVLLHREPEYVTAVLIDGSPGQFHTHAHRDAAVDDFHARAGLLYKAR
jgi:hypothetical protein